jgi:hypothetical protein
MFFGAILSVGGAIWLAFDSSKKSDKISELNQQIAGSVTGGDSFCYLFPSPSYGKLNTIDFHLHHKGEYPVYDIFIRVWDESCLERIDHGQLYEKHHGYRTKEVTRDEWLKMKEDPEFIRKDIEMQKEMQELMRNCLILQEKLGTIPPNTGTNVMDTSLVSCTAPKGIDLSKFSQKYVINIVARNGQYYQTIMIDIRNKRWHIYSKVEKVISDSKRIVVREYESQDMEGFVIKLIK